VGDLRVQPFEGGGGRRNDDDPVSDAIVRVDNGATRRAPRATGQELDDDLLLRLVVLALALPARRRFSPLRRCGGRGPALWEIC
jgi:hypothetical protein